MILTGSLLKKLVNYFILLNQFPTLLTLSICSFSIKKLSSKPSQINNLYPEIPTSIKLFKLLLSYLFQIKPHSASYFLKNSMAYWLMHQSHYSIKIAGAMFIYKG